MLTSILLLALQAVAPPSGTAKADAEKIRCQPEYLVHTRIPTQICRTKAEWHRIEQDQQADLESSRNAVGAGRTGTIAGASGRNAEAIITSITIPGAKGPSHNSAILGSGPPR
jgi:hypothetical protein